MSAREISAVILKILFPAPVFYILLPFSVVYIFISADFFIYDILFHTCSLYCSVIFILRFSCSILTPVRHMNTLAFFRKYLYLLFNFFS